MIVADLLRFSAILATIGFLFKTAEESWKAKRVCFYNPLGYGTYIGVTLLLTGWIGFYIVGSLWEVRSFFLNGIIILLLGLGLKLISKPDEA